MIVDNASQPGAQNLDYNAATPTVVIPITDFFSEFLGTATDECGAVTCNLVVNSCTTPYDQASNFGALTMDPTSYAVTIKRNIQAGYGPIGFCLQCKSDHQTSNHHSWPIKQYMDCSTSLTPKLSSAITINSVNSPTNLKLLYTTTPTLTYISSYLDVFDNMDSLSGCPVT